MGEDEDEGEAGLKEAVVEMSDGLLKGGSSLRRHDAGLPPEIERGLAGNHTTANIIIISSKWQIR
ncbi:hypothetical protein TWF694_009143 [Orbilia ellipsospora]|uniref:Uncharacterized protein n=1 Tax=Orbilia ellipsospora TaxID=2528407 RepID=A0AAV9XE06_9PEZI